MIIEGTVYGSEKGKNDQSIKYYTDLILFGKKWLELCPLLDTIRDLGYFMVYTMLKQGYACKNMTYNFLNFEVIF